MTEHQNVATIDRAEPRDRPPSIEVRHVTVEIEGTSILQKTSLDVQQGEVVGIAGGSGAGKTTLLEAIAGLRAPTGGRVARAGSSAFVPQEDVIHRELPLRRTLLHAAALRLHGHDALARAAKVDAILERLDLSQQAAVGVGDLSGGQRKRASLGAELLSDADLLFLDEPTSGLDPSSAGELLGSLRRLAAAGSTVVLSTHSPADLARCDRIVFMARGGRVAYIGSPADARIHFGVTELSEAYQLLNDWPEDGTVGSVGVDEDERGEPRFVPKLAESPMAPSAARQWVSLVRRNVDLIKSNRLTLAILLGSPAFIISMMTLLFPAGAFDVDSGSAALAIQTLFWLAFNSFFFGITYGLLQVVGEIDIVRRERHAGLRIGAYIASKMTVLLPLLAVVNVAQIVAMESANRLPDLTGSDFIAIFVTLQLLSSAATVFGLHASSAVQNPAQATLALPMLCFPQVLFAGAVVPVSAMGWLAEAMSMPLAVRWGFEPLGRILDVAPAAAGEKATAGFVETFNGSPTTGWIVLMVLVLMGSAATINTLRKRTAPGR